MKGLNLSIVRKILRFMVYDWLRGLILINSINWLTRFEQFTLMKVVNLFCWAVVYTCVLYQHQPTVRLFA